jgi:hypothetical protein
MGSLILTVAALLVLRAPSIVARLKRLVPG